MMSLIMTILGSRIQIGLIVIDLLAQQFGTEALTGEKTDPFQILVQDI